MARNFRTDVEKVIEEATVDIISGSAYTYQSASFLVTDSGSVTQFHSPILIPVASASALPTPNEGTGSLYVKYTDDKIYFKNSQGTEYNLTDTGGGGGGTPGGSDTQIQYNNGGSFGGVASMTFDDSSGHLTIIDDKQLKFGTNGDAHIEYDENGDDVLLINGAATKFTVAGVEIENGSTTGATALSIDNDDVDQVALYIDAANTTANVAFIEASSLTTGKGLVVYSDSNSTSTRDLMRIRNDNTAADATTLLRLMNDADPDDTAENASMVIEHTFNANGRANLALTSTNSTGTAAPALALQKTTTSLADDAFLGIIRFQGKNSSNDLHEYASIVGITSDVTDGDEGGLIKLFVHAGGTAGTAGFKELLNIGGEDVVNGTVPAVVVNEDGINCDFRVESDGEDEAIFLDASAETLYINKGESDFTTQIHSTNDVAMTVGAAGVIFNEDGHATNDFRVESDNETHMLFVDSSQNAIGIGTNDPDSGILHIHNDSHTHAEQGVPIVFIDQDVNSAAFGGPCLQIGTHANPAANTAENVINIFADSLTTAAALHISADALTTGEILDLVSNSSSNSARSLVKIHNDHTSAGEATPLEIVNDGGGKGIKITASGADDDPTLDITSSTGDGKAVVKIVPTSLRSDGYAFLIESDEDDNSSRSIAKIHNDHANATGATCLELLNDAAGTTQDVLISTGTTTGDVFDINCNSLTTGNAIDISANGLTTGGILNLVSDSANTSARTLVTVKNDNTAATGAVVMHLVNDAIGGDGDPILMVESTAEETHAIVEIKKLQCNRKRRASIKI